jgi:hypothetical protein
MIGAFFSALVVVLIPGMIIYFGCKGSSRSMVSPMPWNQRDPKDRTSVAVKVHGDMKNFLNKNFAANTPTGRPSQALAPMADPTLVRVTAPGKQSSLNLPRLMQTNIDSVQQEQVGYHPGGQMQQNSQPDVDLASVSSSSDSDSDAA